MVIIDVSSAQRVITSDVSNADIARQHEASHAKPDVPQVLSKSTMAAYRRAKAASAENDKIATHKTQIIRMERAGKVDNVDVRGQTSLFDF